MADATGLGAAMGGRSADGFDHGNHGGAAVGRPSATKMPRKSVLPDTKSALRLPMTFT